MGVGGGCGGDWGGVGCDAVAVRAGVAEAVGSGGRWRSRRLKGLFFGGGLCATRGSNFSLGGGGCGVEICAALLWRCIFLRLNGSAGGDVLCDIGWVVDLGGG